MKHFDHISNYLENKYKNTMDLLFCYIIKNNFMNINYSSNIPTFITNIGNFILIILTIWYTKKLHITGLNDDKNIFEDPSKIILQQSKSNYIFIIKDISLLTSQLSKLLKKYLNNKVIPTLSNDSLPHQDQNRSKNINQNFKLLEGINNIIIIYNSLLPYLFQL